MSVRRRVGSAECQLLNVLRADCAGTGWSVVWEADREFSSEESSVSDILRIIPGPQREVALRELYLERDLRAEQQARLPFIYTNFVVSLDGRIAVRDPDSGRWRIPPGIQTPEDQRLYFALAAQADVIICSARHANGMLKNDDLVPFPFLTPVEDSDLKQWRLARGRSEKPAIAVASTRLRFDGGKLKEKLGCPVYAFAGSGADAGMADAMRAAGVEVKVLGDEVMVSGQNMRRALTDWGFELIYSVAGPGVMAALVTDGVLDRLYLTQVDLMVGGKEFHTICTTEAPLKEVGGDFRLQSLYRSQEREGPGQSFLVYELGYSSGKEFN